MEKFVNITERLAGIVPGRKQTLRGVKKRFGEVLPILKTNLTRSTLNKKRTELKNTTKEGDRGNLTKFWRNTCVELSAPVEKGHLKKGSITQKKILPFVIQYHPAVPKLKNILMEKWHLTQN